MGPQQGKQRSKPPCTTTPTTLPQSQPHLRPFGVSARRGRFGHTFVSPAPVPPMPYAEGAARFPHFTSLSERSLPAARPGSVSVSEPEQATLLATDQIAEIALVLSKNMNTPDIENFLESLLLSTASRHSLRQTYRTDHPLWIYSGISEAIEEEKISGFAHELSKLLNTLKKPNLAEKITAIASQPGATPQQEPARLKDLPAIGDTRKVASKLKHPLLVGLLSGLSHRRIYQIRTQQGSVSHGAQLVLFHLQKELGDQSASRFFQALELTDNDNALVSLGRRSKPTAPESAPRRKASSFHDADQSQPPSISVRLPRSERPCLGPPGTSGASVVSAEESKVVWPAAATGSTFAVTTKDHMFSYDELMLITAENYKFPPPNRQKRGVPRTGPGRRADFIAFLSQFSGQTIEGEKWNPRIDDDEDRFREAFQQKQLEYLRKIVITPKFEALKTKQSLSIKEALIFFAIKARAMDLAARMCRVMYPGRDDLAYQQFQKTKTSVKKYNYESGSPAGLNRS